MDDLDREIAEAVPDTITRVDGSLSIETDVCYDENDRDEIRARVRALVERERIYAHKLTEEEIAAYEARGAAKALRNGAGRAMERCGSDLRVICPHCQGIARELNAGADAIEKGERGGQVAGGEAVSAFENWWEPRKPTEVWMPDLFKYAARAAWNAAVEACANHLADHDDCLRHDAGCQFSSDEIRKLKADG